MELITLKEIKKSYARGPERVEVLKGINLSIGKGETIAVVGASGVGKSTLLNIMGALDRPTSGEVRCAGESLLALDDRRLAALRNRFIGFVFQFHHLLPEFTALENVMLPALIGGMNPNQARTKAQTLLSEVGLAERLHHKPGELSGGEQRCAIVRALIQNPQAVLADEPTGNLDTATAQEVFELLLALNKARETALVVVTHNENLAAMMSRRIKMVDGKIIEL